MTREQRVGTPERVHELALMDDLVGLIIEEIRGVRVITLRLEIGNHAGIAPDALRFCFDVCAQGTTLEGARLEIVQTEGDELMLEEVEVT